MLITINILSAMSIVMALFIPYFILLHLNNKLKKEVEGALNRVLEVKQYSEITNKILDGFIVETNENLDIHIENTRDAFRLHNQLHDKTITFMNVVEKRINQKQTLKKILENPIEVKKPACETKLKLKEEVNANDIKTVTEIVNKVDFKHSSRSFEKGDIFILTEDNLKIYRNKILFYENYSYTTFVSNVMKKLLKLNELNEN